MSEFVSAHKPDLQKVIEHFQKEIAGLRISRAAPALVENIIAEAYGVPTPIVHLASITMQDAKSLVIRPWDKNNLKNIEKALQAAGIGASITVEGEAIRVIVSSMTEETRKEVIKKLNQKTEEAKVSLRSKREKIREQIIKQEKDKIIAEDEKFKSLEELDELIKDFNEKIKEIAQKKETEIMVI